MFKVFLNSEHEGHILLGARQTLLAIYTLKEEIVIFKPLYVSLVYPHTYNLISQSKQYSSTTFFVGMEGAAPNFVTAIAAALAA